MSDEKVPADLDVELRWPQQKEQDRLSPLPPSEAREVSGAARVIGPEREAVVPSRALAERPATTLEGLLRQLARAMQNVPTSDSLAELTRRVDALARAVEHMGAGPRTEPLLEELRDKRGPLDKAPAEVRRLTSVIATSLAARVER